jgi:hypothetical protein
MNIDPSAKKALDLRFARGEIDKNTYLSAIQTLAETSSLYATAPTSEEPKLGNTLIWDREPPLCDADFDGDINHVKEPVSALRQLACLDQLGTRNYFKLIRLDTGDFLEARSANQHYLLKYARASSLEPICRSCSEEIAASLLYGLYSETYDTNKFTQYLLSLPLAAVTWPASIKKS